MSEGVAIVGHGAWGSALGASLRADGRAVTMLGRGETLSNTVDIALTLMAVPAQATRAALSLIAETIPPGTPVIATAKGLEHGSLLRQSEIFGDVLGTWPVGVLSGPSFADDLRRGLPTAVTLAMIGDPAEPAQTLLATGSLRPYLSDDLIGVEIGGALKNVIAIACGTAIGAGLGESARAALMTRGFAELNRIGLALGARAETLAGLSGLGDLTLTSTSRLSRNFRFGVALGETGGPPEGTGTYEGATTAAAACRLADQLGVNAPIIDTVSALVTGAVTVPDAIQQLYRRPLTREI